MRLPQLENISLDANVTKDREIVKEFKRRGAEKAIKKTDTAHLSYKHEENI